MTASELMTVAEFQSIPDPPGGRYELHLGELVFVTFARPEHNDIEHSLVQLLRPFARGLGVVRMEYPFRVMPEFDLRSADVAFISHSRREQMAGDYLAGAPELVIEVLSPSNTRKEMREKASLCLTHGALQFWEVDAAQRCVFVSSGRGTRLRAGSGGAIDLRELFGAGELPVDEIFAPAED